jgi:hypothetical protein
MQPWLQSAICLHKRDRVRLPRLERRRGVDLIVFASVFLTSKRGRRASAEVGAAQCREIAGKSRSGGTVVRSILNPVVLSEPNALKRRLLT